VRYPAHPVVFLTELMRVFPNTVHLGDSKVKIILSCRSHHFEDLKAQSSFFRGLGRDNSAQQDYRAMLKTLCIISSKYG
jgi:hypothetical protein